MDTGAGLTDAAAGKQNVDHIRATRAGAASQGRPTVLGEAVERASKVNPAPAESVPEYPQCGALLLSPGRVKFGAA